MTAIYDESLHCEVIHEPSQSKIETDAPQDNMGKGENFSPTDLVGAALLSCMLTTMGIVAKRDGMNLKGARGSVKKIMKTSPTRMIDTLEIEIILPKSMSEDERKKMQRVALQCPVHKSLHPDVKIPVNFI